MLIPVGPSYCYDAVVLKVIDGDTVDVMLDLGFKVHVKQRLRLLDVYAAERSQPLGPLHTLQLKEMLSPGSEVLIITDKTDKYGRYVATIWKDDININEKQQAIIGEKMGTGF